MGLILMRFCRLICLIFVLVSPSFANTYSTKVTLLDIKLNLSLFVSLPVGVFVDANDSSGNKLSIKFTTTDKIEITFNGNNQTFEFSSSCGCGQNCKTGLLDISVKVSKKSVHLICNEKESTMDGKTNTQGKNKPKYTNISLAPQGDPQFQGCLLSFDVFSASSIPQLSFVRTDDFLEQYCDQYCLKINCTHSICSNLTQKGGGCETSSVTHKTTTSLPITTSFSNTTIGRSSVTHTTTTALPISTSFSNMTTGKSNQEESVSKENPSDGQRNMIIILSIFAVLVVVAVPVILFFIFQRTMRGKINKFVEDRFKVFNYASKSSLNTGQYYTVSDIGLYDNISLKDTSFTPSKTSPNADLYGIVNDSGIYEDV